MAIAHAPAAIPVTIADVLREVAALRARVQALEARTAPQQGSTTDAAAFVLTIAAATRGRVFNSRDLLNHAAVDDGLRVALQGLTAKRLGKKLRALAGRPYSGWMVSYVGRDGDGALWVVQVVDALT